MSPPLQAVKEPDVDQNFRSLGADIEAASGQLEAMPHDYGVVAAPPTAEPTPAKGDRCAYKAATGVYWDLIYTGEETHPWAKVGGPPLVASSNTERALSKETYTSLPTDPLAITAPLKGDYDITIQAAINNVAENRTGWLSYAVGATAASDNWGIIQLVVAGIGLSSLALTTRQTAVAASAVIEEKGRSAAAAEVKFTRRRLIVDPVRVG